MVVEGFMDPAISLLLKEAVTSTIQHITQFLMGQNIDGRHLIKKFDNIDKQHLRLPVLAILVEMSNLSIPQLCM